MSSPFGPLRLIVNPHAGDGSVLRSVEQLSAALRDRGLEFDLCTTAGPGDATRAARTALEQGLRYLVAVGGDGTVHEVVNGMFDGAEPVAGDAVLGVAAAGSGCDFARTFGLDRPPAVIARHLAGGNVFPIDVGQVRYRDAVGREARRLFANIAEVGYGAEVVRLAGRLPRRLGRVRYLLAAWGAIRSLDRAEASVRLANTERTVPVVNLVVANGQFFGGGMKVAPRALPDDGRFNVQVFSGPRSQVFMLTQRIYRGEHLPHEDISEHHTPTVELRCAQSLPVEADGELLGTTPASFSILHRALRLKI